RVHVDELRHVSRERLPVVDELSLAYQLADPAADHVQPDHRAVGHSYQLDHALRLENVALEVSTEVVDVRLDVVGAVLLAGAQLGEADRGHLRVTVGHPRDPVLVDGRSEEHTSELQSRENLVCRLLLEKKKKN